MSELKLTIGQLKNYLGTGLKLYMDYDEESYVDVLTGIVDDHYFTKHGEGDDYEIEGIKPYFYRLSDLDKFIPELGFVPLKELFPQWKWDEETESEQWFIDDSLQMMSATYQLLKGPTLTFDRMQKLFQWHFWPFGDEYFEAGLVIDKLKQNVVP